MPVLLAQIQCLKVEWSSLQGFGGHWGNRLLRSVFSPTSLPWKVWWKNQGTLNPFSENESTHRWGIPAVPSGHPGCWEWPSWSSRPAAWWRGDEQLRHWAIARVNPGCSLQPLAGPIKDFLQKYHFPAAGWLDFANCLWPLAAQEASAGRTWPAWGSDTPRSSLGQNRKVCTNKVCMIQDEKGARENNPPCALTLLIYQPFEFWPEDQELP